MESSSETTCRIRCRTCGFEAVEGSPQEAGDRIVGHFWVYHSLDVEAEFREHAAAVDAAIAAGG